MKLVEGLISFSVKNKFLITLFIAGWIVTGVYFMLQLPLDAVPDITNNQVQVVTVSPTLAPQEVEKLITYPVEVSMANIPNVVEIRSISRFGLSVVSVVFEESVPILDARQYVKEQIGLAEGEIPAGLGSPELMPITTGLGEIYQYTLEVEPGYEDKYDAMELRTVQDWIVKRQMAGTPGIVEVSSFGGYLKQYEVSVNPALLNTMGLTLSEVFQALEMNNQNSGGSYIEKTHNTYYIRSEGLVNSVNDIENIVVALNGGVPILIKDVGQVNLGHAPRFGAMTKDGKGEAVGGITLMLKGASSSEVIDAVHQRVAEVQKSLPEGLVIKPYLDRSVLVSKAIHTVAKNLLEGGLIVIFVLVLLLGNFRAGLVVASVIPLSLLFAFVMMSLTGVSANLMSLGAVDFGIVVDGAVIIVEGVLHLLYSEKLGQKLSRKEMDDVIIKAASSIYRSAAFGVLIILVVFIPIMSLTGVEGKMFRPMALTVSYAVLGALILSLTYVPMISAFVLKRDIKEHSSFADKIVDAIRRAYQPLLEGALKKPALVAGVSIALLVASVFAFTTMGSEFIPDLEEGDLAMQMAVQPGSSLSESIATSTKAEQILLANFPEVNSVVSKIGTAEVPTDPMAVEDADIMILLKDKSEWTSATNRADLVEQMKEALSVIAGASFEFTQPIQLRFNELMTGAKTDIAVKIYGEDLEKLAELGRDASGIIEGIDGAGDVKVEQTEGLPQMIVKFDRSQIARYGLNIQDLNSVIRTAYAGEISGIVFENDRRFDLVVRLDTASRGSVDLGRLYVHTAKGLPVPLSELATLNIVDGPSQISRENTKRRITVGVNVRNRDIASLVAEIESELTDKLDLPPGYTITYGGQFENLVNARNRLMIAVPVALALIFILLYFAFGSFKYAGLIFTAVPLSAIGGIAALLIRGMPFSISAGVGFIALFGVAVLNGIVLISYFDQLKKEGNMDIWDIVITGAKVRLRPVLMTASVASLGFLPMAISSSAGAEVQKPLATVVIGGLISATLLTLLVLPVFYYIIERKGFKLRGSKAVIWIGVLFMLGIGSVQAQQVIPADSVVPMLIQNHPYLKNAQLEVEKSQLQKKQAFQLPGLDVGMEYGQINAADMDYFFSVNQSLGNIGEHVAKGKVANAEIGLSQAKQGMLLKQLSYQARKAWYNWKFQTVVTDIYQQQIELYKQLQGKADVLLQTGEISPLQKSYIDTKIAQANLQLQTAIVQQKKAENAMKDLLFTEADIMPATDSLQPMPYPASLSVAADPKLTAAIESQLKVSEAQLKLSRTQWVPSISGGYFNQQLEGVGGFQGVQVGLSLPIWAWSTSAANKQAKLDMTISQNLLQHQQLQINNRLQLAFQELAANKKQLDGLGMQSLELARMLRRTALDEFTAGESDNFQLVQSLDAALQLELDYYKALNTYNNSVLTYEFYTHE